MSKSLSYRSGPLIAHFIGAVEDEWQMYSDSPDDYTIGPPIGFGASSTVYIATYDPAKPSQAYQQQQQQQQSTPIQCALKVVDLDTLHLKSLQLLKRETQLMSLSKHPNVLRVRGTWMTGHKLYIAMRLMKSGSVADVMRYGFPGGLEEDVCRTVLKQALEGLNYLHINGFIHRDLKAANLLIDKDGTVLLGDLGVAVALLDEEGPLNSSSRKVINTESGKVVERPNHVGRSALQAGKRRSFVGTPCWMAPEVISQKQYDAKADIWSFGITALELTQGRAPRSREPPHKVLLRTLNDKPPALDRTGGPFKYSSAFQEMVESCLEKDPTKRPTAKELLKSPFFRNTKKKSYLVDTILKDLPPLVDRQERRKQASGHSASTMDSWDFGSIMTHMSTATQHWSLDPCISPLPEADSEPEAKISYTRAVASEQATVLPSDTAQEEREPPLSRVSTISSQSDSSAPQTPPSSFVPSVDQSTIRNNVKPKSTGGGLWRVKSTDSDSAGANTVRRPSFGLSSGAKTLKERFNNAFDRTNNS